MTTKLDRTIIAGLNPDVRKALHDYARFPTKRNECYFVGYLSAARTFGGLLLDHYNYLLTLSGTMSRDRVLTDDVFNETLERK